MRTLASVVMVLVFAGLVALVVWFLAIRHRHPLRDVIANLLQLVAVYTFVVSLLSKAGVFTEFGSLERGLTSADPLEFLGANFTALAILFLVLATALDPNTGSSGLRFLLGVPVLLAYGILLFVYTLVHLLAIVPVAYFGYLIASVPIDAILNARSDFEITGGEEKFQVGKAVRANEMALRHFLVALPAFVLAQVLKFAPLLRRNRPSAAAVTTA